MSSDRRRTSLQRQQQRQRSFGAAASEQYLRQASRQRRQDSAVELRKQRKEALLRRRRQIGSNSSINSDDVDQAFTSLDTVLNNSDVISQLHTLIVSDSNIVFLERLLDDNDRRSKLFKHLCLSMSNYKSTSEQQQIRLTVDILLQLASVGHSFGGSGSGNNDYYGSAPVKWTDVILEHGVILPACLDLAMNYSLDNAVQLLGTLVLESPHNSLSHVLPHWSHLVQALPTTSFLCATILKQDHVTLGSHFLSALTPTHLVKLLQHNASANYAISMIESLCKREDDAISLLCNDKTLMSTVATCLDKAIQVPSFDFMIPALHALESMAVACDGSNVPIIISTTGTNSNCTLLNSCAQILKQGLVIDVLPLSGALLCDAGSPGHDSTNIAVPILLPHVLQIIANHESVTATWCREAALVLNTTLQVPPGNDMFYMSRDIQESLDQIVQKYWYKTERGKDFFEQVLRGLLDLLQKPDIEGLLSSLYIIDRLLRRMPQCRESIEVLNGIDMLDLVCSRAVGVYSADLEEASNIAAALLDNFFDDEGDEEFKNDSPGQQQKLDQFVFRELPDAPFSFPVANMAPPTVPSLGRGRGRVVPAWMQQTRE